MRETSLTPCQNKLFAASSQTGLLFQLIRPFFLLASRNAESLDLILVIHVTFSLSQL